MEGETVENSFLPSAPNQGWLDHGYKMAMSRFNRNSSTYKKVEAFGGCPNVI